MPCECETLKQRGDGAESASRGLPREVCENGTRQGSSPRHLPSKRRNKSRATMNSPALPHGESVRPGRAPLEKGVGSERRLRRECGPARRSRRGPRPPQVSALREPPSSRARSLSCQPHPYDAPTKSHHQAVRHRHDLIRIGRLVAVRTEGDAAALNVPARFLIALRQFNNTKSFTMVILPSAKSEGDISTSAISLGSCRCENCFSHSAWAAAAASEPWYEATTSRLSVFLAAIGCVMAASVRLLISPSGRSVRKVNHSGMRSSGMLIVLANCSLADSPTPM